MMLVDRRKERSEPVSPKKAYCAPKLTTHGTIDKITGWFGGPWGEFFGGPVSGWNPWSNHGGGGNCGGGS